MANREAVAAFIREALRKDPRLTQTAIAERTAELPAPYGEISAKVLYTAKSGGSVERRSLETIAAMFSQLLGREIRPSELEGAENSAVESHPTPAAGSIHQETTVTGDGAIGGSVATGGTFQVAVGAPLKRIDEG